jgi:hypothetical protein
MKLKIKKGYSNNNKRMKHKREHGKKINQIREKKKENNMRGKKKN